MGRKPPSFFFRAVNLPPYKIDKLFRTQPASMRLMKSVTDASNESPTPLVDSISFKCWTLKPSGPADEPLLKDKMAALTILWSTHSSAPVPRRGISRRSKFELHFCCLLQVSLMLVWRPSFLDLLFWMDLVWNVWYWSNHHFPKQRHYYNQRFWPGCWSEMSNSLIVHLLLVWSGTQELSWTISASCRDCQDHQTFHSNFDRREAVSNLEPFGILLIIPRECVGCMNVELSSAFLISL